MPSRRTLIASGTALIAAAGIGTWYALGRASPVGGGLGEPANRLDRLLRYRATSGDAVNPDTRFQAASLSKTINALAALSLVRDGLLDLDAPANSYLAGWQLTGIAPETVTIAMLLSHTAGTNVPGFDGYPPGAAIPTLEQILDGQPPANSQAIRVVATPGTQVAYSGGGTTVLQKLVGNVTGRPYGQVVAERVLGPLGMRNSEMAQPPTDTTNLALGHDAAGALLPGGYTIHPELAAAGLWTTPGDLTLALAAIMDSVNGQPRSFLPEALARRMITPVMDDAALGVFSDGAGTFYHAGSNRGFRSFYRAGAGTGRAIVIMCNGDGGDAVDNRMQEVLRDTPKTGVTLQFRSINWASARAP